ncbi:MAG: hypothetical protein Q8L37_01595 [Candidatus Gottesmanbacteria bacterium]|nr:hypothetical protein [Candidatus Gottesmanbacteria bacterium]
MRKFIVFITGLVLVIIGLVTLFEAVIIPMVMPYTLFLIITGIYLIKKYSYRVAVGIIILVVIIGAYVYYMSNPNIGAYKGVKIIKTDLGPKIEENQATNGTGVYVIPDYINGLHILLTRGNRLYGINSNTGYKKTNVVSTILEIQDEGYIGNNIGKFMLGCDQLSHTCFILDFRYNYSLNYANLPYYSPVKIISYNYFTQIFSTIYTFQSGLQEPRLINKIIKYPSAATIIINSDLDNLYYNVIFQTAQVNNINKIPDLQGNTELTFLVKDQNYFTNNKYPGLISGDSTWTVVTKSECASGGMGGCDNVVSIFKNDNLKNVFNCHNCSVFYMGKLQNKLLLLIQENLKFKIGEIEEQE